MDGIRRIGYGNRVIGIPAASKAIWLLIACAGLAGVPSVKAAPAGTSSEAVINGALEYLASQQAPNGGWLGITKDEKQHPIAITGCVLIAFQAAGQLPDEGRYGRHVKQGMNYLLRSIDEDGVIGDRSNGQYMYSHGIASIALAELYGEARVPDVRSKLERAIKLIISCQNHEGGWRYRPVPRDADVSVTVLQLTALRAAKNAGFDVPERTINRGIGYVKQCYHPESGGFTYQPGRSPGFARTAAAIYSLQVCGLYDEEMVRTGSAYLFDNFKVHDDWFTYGHFYAAPAQYMLGGEVWSRWYELIRKPLLENVIRKGNQAFWDSGRAQLDRGRSGVGPIYATAVYTMILAMPYHYLPLYQR